MSKCQRCSESMPSEYEYATCPKCREKERLRIANKREEKRELEIQQGNINAGLKKVKHYEDEEDAIIYRFPIVSNDCIEYRRQLIGLDEREPLFFDFHHCEPCRKFYALVHGFSVEGVDLWQSSERQ